MAKIVFDTETMDPETLPILLQCLEGLNRVYLRRHPETPIVYRAGVRYEREAPGQEQWRSISRLYALRRGDCEDIACALAAYRQLHGEPGAFATFTWRERNDGSRLYHIIVQRENGDIEDPCRALGM